MRGGACHPERQRRTPSVSRSTSFYGQDSSSLCLPTRRSRRYAYAGSYSSASPPQNCFFLPPPAAVTVLPQNDRSTVILSVSDLPTRRDSRGASPHAGFLPLSHASRRAAVGSISSPTQHVRPALWAQRPRFATQISPLRRCSALCSSSANTLPPPATGSGRVYLAHSSR